MKDHDSDRGAQPDAPLPIRGRGPIERLSEAAALEQRLARAEAELARARREIEDARRREQDADDPLGRIGGSHEAD
jgi:hypothetical protein